MNQLDSNKSRAFIFSNFNHPKSPDLETSPMLKHPLNDPFGGAKIGSPPSLAARAPWPYNSTTAS